MLKAAGAKADAARLQDMKRFLSADLTRREIEQLRADLLMWRSRRATMGRLAAKSLGRRTITPSLGVDPVADADIT